MCQTVFIPPFILRRPSIRTTSISSFRLSVDLRHSNTHSTHRRTHSRTYTLTLTLAHSHTHTHPYTHERPSPYSRFMRLYSRKSETCARTSDRAQVASNQPSPSTVSRTVTVDLSAIDSHDRTSSLRPSIPSSFRSSFRPFVRPSLRPSVHSPRPTRRLPSVRPSVPSSAQPATRETVVLSRPPRNPTNTAYRCRGKD